MQCAADGAERVREQGGQFGAIVSDLTSLLEHVQASIELIDSAIAREVTAADSDNANVIVLDDVTPQYMKASHALNSCSRNLDTALRFLLDAATSAARPARRSGHS